MRPAGAKAWMYLIQSHQKYCAFRRFGFGGEFSGALPIVIENPHPHPPVPCGTCEVLYFRRVIAALEMVGQFGGGGFVGESADLHSPFSGRSC